MPGGFNSHTLPSLADTNPPMHDIGCNVGVLRLPLIRAPTGQDKILYAPESLEDRQTNPANGRAKESITKHDFTCNQQLTHIQT